MTDLWTTSALRQLLGSSGQLRGRVSGLSIDTRTLQQGDLFVALKGPIADGHEHLQEAFRKGASGALIERQPEAFLVEASVTEASACFVVDDSFEALQRMARDRRTKARAQVVGITGSYGKTSCKEALCQLLSRQHPTHGTKSSFNNHWGVPLSLASLPLEARFGIFEVGMNHPGEIAPLARLVQPDVALITTIAGAHLGPMGTLRAIAVEKASLFEGMKPGGVAILREDSAEIQVLEQHARDKGVTRVMFGRGPRAFARLKSATFEAEGLKVTAEIDGKPYQLLLPVVQQHWALSALGVLATICVLGGDVGQAAEDFRTYKALEGRGVKHQISHQEGDDILLLDESYNAGPDSMEEAIAALGRLTPRGRGRRIAILADMLELGEETRAAHRALAPLLEKAQVECLFTLGTHIEALHDVWPSHRLVAHVSSQDQMDAFVAAILTHLVPGDVYLVKGSRGQRAYRGRLASVVDALKGEQKGNLV